MQRRHFLATLAGAAAVLAVSPARGSGSKVLLWIELAGGNDGLNSFIPYQDPNYLKLRPTLGIQDGIPVSSTVALHPALSDLKPLLDQGRLAVVQNVGYPKPDLSHFRSKEIWQSASMQPAPETGWLGRYLEVTPGSVASTPIRDGIFVGEEYPLALTGSKGHYLHLSPNLSVNGGGNLGKAIRALYDSPQSEPLAEKVRQTVLESTQAVDKLQKDLKKQTDRNNYPKGQLGDELALMSRMLDSGARVLYLSLGGWDTHTNQRPRQENLLSQLGQGLAALDRDLKSRGLDKDVMVMVQSEFGRRPAQNGSGGTDHGTAGPVLMLGSVKPGFYGGDPALDSLVNGNLPMKLDFRGLYGEVLSRWLGGDSKQILGSEYPPVGVLA